jgi:hypothetical protein
MSDELDIGCSLFAIQIPPALHQFYCGPVNKCSIMDCLSRCQGLHTSDTFLSNRKQKN